MASPVYKGGYGVVGESASIALDGERVSFNSLGGFAGILFPSGTGANYYLARRSNSGWSTVGLQPPFGSPADFSENLEYTLGNGTVGPNGGAQLIVGNVDEFQLHNNDAPNVATSWELFGLPLRLVNGEPLTAIEEGASGDFCHLVVGHFKGALLPVAERTNDQIYDLSRGCGGTLPALHLVALSNKSTETLINRNGCATEVELGLGSNLAFDGEQESKVNSIAAEGRELFFTQNVAKGPEACGTKIALQVFVRLDGKKTIEVSRPFETGPFGGCGDGGKAGEVPGEVPCPGATSRGNSFFKGASEDGSRVFFTTTAPLVKGDEDAQSDLYMANIGCPESRPGCEVSERQVTSLVRISQPPASGGEAGEVLGVMRLAPDGSRVYFVAHGVLSEGPDPEGRLPVKGADNLYVYDSESRSLEFIAELCSGPELSGTVEDVQCPHDLEAGGSKSDVGLWGSLPEAQSSGTDASFLVFSSYAQLIADDTDNAKDIYRYDTGTGLLQRVSVGEAGFGADGNGNDTPEGPTKSDATIRLGHMGGDAHVLEQGEMRTRAISADGGRIVFTTAEALSPQATNDLSNVYEWDEGRVSLISTGSADQPDRDVVITPRGRDVFFTTSQGLLPQDTDGALDVYDARLGGGEQEQPAVRQPCSGDACQGPLTNPAPLFVPGSVLQAPGEQLFSPKKMSKVKKKKGRAKRRVGRGKRKARRADGMHASLGRGAQ